MKKKEYNKYFRKYGHPPPRKCKVCDVDIGKGKSFCGDCGRKRGHSRKYPICGYDGCKKERVFNKHNCLYHTKEKRYERHMNSLIFCKDCSGEIGKRKDVGKRSLCDECKKKNKEVYNIKQRKYRNEYYKNRYNTDEEYRKKVRDYQYKWKQMIKEVK